MTGWLGFVGGFLWTDPTLVLFAKHLQYLKIISLTAARFSVHFLLISLVFFRVFLFFLVSLLLFLPSFMTAKNPTSKDLVGQWILPKHTLNWRSARGTERWKFSDPAAVQAMKCLRSSFKMKDRHCAVGIWEAHRIGSPPWMWHGVIVKEKKAKELYASEGRNTFPPPSAAISEKLSESAALMCSPQSDTWAPLIPPSCRGMLRQLLERRMDST